MGTNGCVRKILCKPTLQCGETYKRFAHQQSWTIKEALELAKFVVVMDLVLPLKCSKCRYSWKQYRRHSCLFSWGLLLYLNLTNILLIQNLIWPFCLPLVFLCDNTNNLNNFLSISGFAWVFLYPHWSFLFLSWMHRDHFVFWIVSLILYNVLVLPERETSQSR